MATGRLMSVSYNYCTGHAGSVLGELRRAVGQYARRYEHIKIGITYNPEKRFLEHQKERAREDDSWAKMVVIYETSSRDAACRVEKTLVEYVQSRGYKTEIWNGTGGGGGRIPADWVNYYVYILLDVKR